MIERTTAGNDSAFGGGVDDANLNLDRSTRAAGPLAGLAERTEGEGLVMSERKGKRS